MNANGNETLFIFFRKSDFPLNTDSKIATTTKFKHINQENIDK